MQYQTYSPASTLSPYILNYWQLNLTPGSIPSSNELILPDGNASLMFTGHPVHRMMVGEEVWEDLSGRAVFIGQKTKAVEYAFPPDRHVITWGVRFQPAGVRAFSQCSMHECTDKIVEADQVFSKPVAPLMQLIQNEAPPNFILESLNTFFLSQLISHQTPLITTSAMASTLASEPRAIGHIADQFRMSTRQMERYFKTYVGLPPKTYSCITRFNLAVMEGDHYPDVSLAEISEAAGYFDTVHMHRESIKICGHKPQEVFSTQRGQTRPFLTELIRQRKSSITY